VIFDIRCTGLFGICSIHEIDASYLHTRNLTEKTTYLNNKLPLLFKVLEIWSVDS